MVKRVKKSSSRFQVKRRKISKALYWTPRIAAIAFIAFLALFSLDIFGNGYTFWETVVGLFMHNLPVFILALLLWLSWKREWIGALTFILAGIAYIISLFFRNQFEWYMISWSLTIAAPAFAVGVLFWMNWIRRKKKK